VGEADVHIDPGDGLHEVGLFEHGARDGEGRHRLVDLVPGEQHAGDGRARVRGLDVVRAEKLLAERQRPPVIAERIVDRPPGVGQPPARVEHHPEDEVGTSPPVVKRARLGQRRPGRVVPAGDPPLLGYSAQKAKLSSPALPGRDLGSGRTERTTAANASR
jgi:hypothetical protein